MTETGEKPLAEACPAGVPEGLWKVINNAPDVVLQLTDGTLPAHSQLLRLCSEPLATAVDALPAAGAGERVLPIETNVKDWCTVASMLYPVAEPATITWGNVETVTLLADKYGIPNLLQRAAAFLAASVEDMAPFCSSGTIYGTECPCCSGNVTNAYAYRASVFSGQSCKSCGYNPRWYTDRREKDIWKWLQLADRLDMEHVVAKCISAIVRHHRISVTAARLACLSSRVKDLLLLKMSNPGQAA
jgi:hypothetical protein